MLTAPIRGELLRLLTKPPQLATPKASARPIRKASPRCQATTSAHASSSRKTKSRHRTPARLRSAAFDALSIALAVPSRKTTTGVQPRLPSRQLAPSGQPTAQTLLIKRARLRIKPRRTLLRTRLASDPTSTLPSSLAGHRRSAASQRALLGSSSAMAAGSARPRPSQLA